MMIANAPTIPPAIAALLTLDVAVTGRVDPKLLVGLGETVLSVAGAEVAEVDVAEVADDDGDETARHDVSVPLLT